MCKSEDNNTPLGQKLCPWPNSLRGPVTRVKTSILSMLGEKGTKHEVSIMNTMSRFEEVLVLNHPDLNAIV